tara:strand:+ start:179 stop:982 length:804 start_codon:yes stop_codon:yes gene_type:complete
MAKSKMKLNPSAEEIDINQYAFGGQNVDDLTQGTADFKGLWDQLKGAKTYKRQITREAGQSLRDAMSGLVDVWTYKDAVMPDGKFDKATLLGMYSPIRLGKSRVGYQSLGRAVEVILRERSGAAVPPEELENYRTLYGPNFIDLATENSESAYLKVDALEDFYKRTIDLFGQGRLDTGELIKGLRKDWETKGFEKRNAESSSILSDGRELIVSGGKYYIAPPPVAEEDNFEYADPNIADVLDQLLIEEEKSETPSPVRNPKGYLVLP